jgi:DNA-binding IclR family transcriptional regulator
MAGGGNGRSGRSVASKVLALLDAFSPSDVELSLNELARRTGLPLSTTYRLASELVEWGGLERAGRGGFRIGLRLWEVGSMAPRTNSLHEIVVPFMQDLHAATGENVQLAVIDGREVLYLEKITGRRSVSVATRRGVRLPLHATGVGKVLLAYSPPELQEEVLASGLKRYSPFTVVAPGHLRRELEEIRRTGIAFAREEFTVGRISVAAPVLDGDGRAAAALSLVVRAAGADVDGLAPAVRTAALCAGRRLRERYRGFDARPSPLSVMTGAVRV